MTLKSVIKKIKAYELGMAHMLVARNTNIFRMRILRQYDLSSVEWFVLGIAQDKTSRGGIRVTDLATILDVKTTYITAALNNLKRKGFVTTESDTHDARVRMVVATKKGEQTVAAVSSLLQKNVEETLRDRVTSEQFENYIYVLREIARVKEQEDRNRSLIAD